MEEPITRRCRLPGFRFADGTILDLDIAYWTLGRLNPAGNNAVLLSPGASGNRDWARPFCRLGGAFDPERWFILSVDLPGGGGSSRARDGVGFPARYGIGDLAASMAGLVRALGLPGLASCGGPSMGGLVGLALAAAIPGLVRSLVLWTSGPGSDGYSEALAQGLASVLSLDGSPAGMRAAAGVFLPALVAREMLAGMAADDRRALLDRMAGEWTANWRGDELAARYRAIAAFDLIRDHGGPAGLAAALSCPVLSLGADTDVILPAEQMAALGPHLPELRCLTLPTRYGHLAAAAPPGSPEFAFFDGETSTFLKERYR